MAICRLLLTVLVTATGIQTELPLRGIYARPLQRSGFAWADSRYAEVSPPWATPHAIRP